MPRKIVFATEKNDWHDYTLPYNLIHIYLAHFAFLVNFTGLLSQNKPSKEKTALLIMLDGLVFTL